MIDIKDKQECCGCAACVQRCPKQCIALKEDAEGFLYPAADASMCIDCGLCEKVCPVINQDEPRQPFQVYAAVNQNEEVRKDSSSGGTFTAIAESIIEDGGVVFGARFNETWEVIHDYTETLEGLKVFRGSKYVQSIVGSSYMNAEKFLKNGRNVLFCGTPCQIAGLRHFLRKDYSNLYLIDIVCHGVPSPRVWKDYIGYECQCNKLDVNTLKKVNFRDKSTGWNRYSVELCWDYSKVKEQHQRNLYMRGYLANLYLRPSCTQCPFKCFSSGSDITLGDFWGIESFKKELFDDRGISLVTVNSCKGKQMLGQVRSLKLDEFDTPILQRFTMLWESTPPNDLSKMFWSSYKGGSSIKWVGAVIPDKSSILYRLRNKISLYIKKLNK